MSFRLRIAIATIALIAVLFSIGGAVLVHTTFQASLKMEEQSALDSNRMVLKLLQIIGEDEGWFGEEDVVSAIQNIGAQDTWESIQLVHGDEVVFQKGEIHQDGTGADGETKVYITYFDAAGNTPYLQTTTYITLNSDTYTLRLGQDLTEIYEMRAQQIGVFRRTFWVLLLCGAVVSWLLATLLTKPLRRLSRASREIASGNLSYRSNIKTDDEIASLSRDFDRMAEKLEENINLLKETADQKERFMGAFTHELKTPMTSIIGYADLLRSQKLTKRDETDALDYIYSEAKRLENLSLKMLDFFVADKVDLRMKAASPSDLVRYVTAHLQGTFEKSNVKMLVQLEKGTCIMEPDLVQTLLINLLDNARKAMEQGGTIYITVEMIADGCRIVVRDEGQGIPPESLQHLTEAFYRVDKARAREKGSAGLGLALCDKIVHMHNGTIEFESVQSEGTTVTVELKGGLL
ncbi:MAG: HAMP domain-containing histidine kinase [Eubacterium sp.]|nr:HAMP domain-containing histidine kinase [Eubacterium sp.]